MGGDRALHITLNEVNPTKCIVILDMDDDSLRNMGAVYVESTALVMPAANDDGATLTGNWQVVEFY